MAVAPDGLEELSGESVESPLPPPTILTLGQPLAAQDQQPCMLPTDEHTIAGQLNHMMTQQQEQLAAMQAKMENAATLLTTATMSDQPGEILAHQTPEALPGQPPQAQPAQSSADQPPAQPEQALADQPPPGQPLAALEKWLQSQLKDKRTWHNILNLTTSTRPKVNGGALFRSLTDVTQQAREGKQHKCTMTLPCAFEHGDGLGFTVSALANTALQAHELACHKAFTKLLSLDAGRVVLRRTSWHCTEEDIVQHFAQVLGTDMHQPLAVPEPRASRSAYEAPEAGEEAEREQAIVNLLRECLENEGGKCDPSNFKQLPDGRKPGLELDHLLKRETLQAFIKSHAEFELVKIQKHNKKGFEVSTGEGKGWGFKWAAAPSPALGSLTTPIALPLLSASTCNH